MADLTLSGDDLVDELCQAGDSADMTALIVQAGRIKRRLDRLNELIDGEDDVWLRLKLPRSQEGVIEVRVDSAMQETRQLETVFRQTLAEITRRRGDDDGPADDEDDLSDL